MNPITQTSNNAKNDDFVRILGIGWRVGHKPFKQFCDAPNFPQKIILLAQAEAKHSGLHL